MNLQILAERLLGTDDIEYVVATLIFSLVGVAISLLMHSLERDKDNPDTPDEYSVKFLLVNNSRRIFLSILLLFVALRFSKPIFGVELTEANAVLIGLSIDKISEFLRSKNILVGKK